jgi:glycerol-1-phosphate dehydrogenase [NAD(P)+]
MNMADLIKDFNIDTAQIGNNDCPCGRKHTANVKEIIIQQGALNRVPSIIKKYGGSNVFIIADKNTYNAAGQLVCEYMKHENLRFSLFVFDNEHLEPDEWAVGQAVMHYDSECDFILGIGSGTINDIGKIVAHTTGLPYMIVGTAPSMDGYASSTSSVVRDGIKISLNSVCPTVIVADLDVMCQAPTILLQAGIGDMLAKYISICEWSISHVITGEYYCEEVASIVRKATKKCACIENLSDIGPENVRPLIEGLIIAGIAMSFAGLSRPASGMEHYFSHIWDMRGLEFNTPSTLHGIQCGVATPLCLRIYKFITGIVPDRKKAIDFVNSFSVEDWNKFLTQFLGKSAKTLIALEKKEGKYDTQLHKKRIEVIINCWDEIIKIISEELPDLEKLKQYMIKVGIPTKPMELGHSNDEVQDTFLVTKDIRDKYIGSRLLWDLGLIEEAKEAFKCD